MDKKAARESETQELKTKEKVLSELSHNGTPNQRLDTPRAGAARRVRRGREAQQRSLH